MSSLDSARAVQLNAFHSSAIVPSYVRRLFAVPQMDLDFALYQMLWLCKNPANVYKLTRHRKDTKNQWARDDPAFMAVLFWFLVVSSVAFGIAFGTIRFTSYLRLIVYSILQFLGTGCVISGGLWYVCNRFLKAPPSQHSVEQDVEWMYSFDIHCNAFVPVFILLHGVQYVLLPFLMTSSFASLFISNTLYLISFLAYCYITVLGYMILPFLHKTNTLLTPVFAMLVLYMLALIFQFNPTITSARWFIGS